MKVTVRVTDMLDSYKKYLEAKLGVELSKQQMFTIDENGKPLPPLSHDLGFMEFATHNEKLPYLK